MVAIERMQLVAPLSVMVPVSQIDRLSSVVQLVFRLLEARANLAAIVLPRPFTQDPVARRSVLNETGGRGVCVRGGG